MSVRKPSSSLDDTLAEMKRSSIRRAGSGLPHIGLLGLVPGRRLDRYELLCPIAEGGMASVWAARQQGKHGFEKLVAFKTILPELAHDPRFRSMFLDEARIAARIEHTNVARILDLGEEGELLYLVMEWVDGDSLSQLQRRVTDNGGKIRIGILLRILADLCGGLHAAHELRDGSGMPLCVVHRDVSPDNILVDTQGVAKLIDFGVAKARDRIAEDTKTGVLKGKISYMAPEQAFRRPADRRADIWSLGAILYQFVSGMTPFRGETRAATLHLLAAGQNPPPLPWAIHPSLAMVIDRALRYDADERFTTAAELQTALENAMIDMRVSTTTHDVATFIGTHMADRIAVRRGIIRSALIAASERDRLGEDFEKTEESTDSVTRIRLPWPQPPRRDATRMPVTKADRATVLGTTVRLVPPRAPWKAKLLVTAALLLLGTIAFSLIRPHRRGVLVSPAPASTAAVAPLPRPNPQEVPPSPAPTISTTKPPIDVMSLPTAPPAPATAKPKRRPIDVMSLPVAPRAPPAAPRPRRKTTETAPSGKYVVDDGF